MINSNERKLMLSGWLKENDFNSYDTPLKLQKFLLLYESLSKVDGEPTDFTYLRGYKKGPVFSNVWGDYTKERDKFNFAAKKAYEDNKLNINNVRAKICSFIVQTLTENELSDFTHKMHLWDSKKERIMSNERQVTLEENDFNSDDVNLINSLKMIYPTEMVENSVVIPLDLKKFVCSKIDYDRLTEQHYDVLLELTKNHDLHNPVFVEIDDEGRLLID